MEEQNGKDCAKYYFPPIDLLAKRKFENINEGQIKETALKIQQTLLRFGIEVQIFSASVGTRFTRYEIIPEMGVRIREIVRLENDIRIATAATDIHIEAPIHGKNAIGIDIANKENSIVTIREMVESRGFIEISSNVPIALGCDIVGNIVVADMVNMPHLLIGGTTGSGKTMFVNTLIMGILCKASPDGVKMLMIDTKGVSLTVYNGIPHLLAPVLTDVAKSLAALEWVVSEIENRYKCFANCGVRDIKGYNAISGELHKMPEILVVIEDLSDLMAMHKREAEQLIVRIAQMSRRVGIYLVIVTRRPSTNVVTGLIKANIPSRIAFSVFSVADSRVILDGRGAEELLGDGDMLFKPQGCLNPIRIQGAYVTDKEINDMVSFLRE